LDLTTYDDSMVIVKHGRPSYVNVVEQV